MTQQIACCGVMAFEHTQRELFRELAPLGALLLFVALVAGYGLSWQTGGQETPVDTAAAQRLPPAPLDAPAPPAAEAPLLIPVEGVAPEGLLDTFDDPRSGGRTHEALDILAPRGTPVRAAADGTVARLFTSDAGGRTVYQLSADSSHVLYYAHLARYAAGLAEGGRVRRGEVLAYVGTSGNAPAGTPHLHFALWAVDDPADVWDGRPINPYPLLTRPPSQRDPGLVSKPSEP